MTWNSFDPACPTRALLDRLADKWTVLVICALGTGPLRFGEVRHRVTGVAPTVLTSVLRALERDGMLVRRVHTASPLRVDYRLTPLGRSLLGVVDALRTWAERQMVKVIDARRRFAAEQD